MSGIYPFQIGTFQCAIIFDNIRQMQIQQIFPTVPSEELVNALHDCGLESEMVEMGFNCLYIDTGQQKILVDSGGGEGQLLGNLSEINVQASDIDTIVITHGDGDHIGGLEQFPNAHFFLPRLAWKLWTEPEKQAGMIEEFIKLFQNALSEAQLVQRTKGRERYGQVVLPSIEDRVTLVDFEAEFIPGIKFVAAPGHRSDHAAVEIQSNGETLLHLVDSIRHPVQVTNPQWTTFIDSYPEQIVTTNKMLLQRANNNNAQVFGVHLTFPGLGHVIQTETGYKWQGRAS
ncbi:MAG: MBL fold metallo-hydrolase [Chloroflexota bacterium]